MGKKIIVKITTILLFLMSPLLSVAQSPEPPQVIVDNIRPGGPEVELVYFDDEIAVYFGQGMNPEVNWMNDYIKQAWIYIKEQYGYFGPDNRIYVVAHKNAAYNFATINTRFDSGFGFRNVIDLGGAWDWENPQRVNYEVITHELAHIVEGGSKDIGGGSPSFIFWADGPWPEIFMYDVYNGIGREDWAEDWLQRILVNTNTHLGGSEQFYFFRDWFYPIYEENGGVTVYNDYFTILSEHFYKRPIEVQNGEIANQYARRTTFGEVLHFFSAASKTDQRQRYESTFGWSEQRERELYEAQHAYPLFYEGNPYNPDGRIDITDRPGTISAEFEVGSPANEGIDKIIDNDNNTKYLTFNGAGWVQFQADQPWVVGSYAIMSANDSATRDPVQWTFQGSTDGTNWVTLDERSEEDFEIRYQHRYFDFENDTAYSYYRLNLNTDAATIMQVAEIRIFANNNVLSTPDNQTINKTVRLYPNPVQNELNIYGISSGSNVSIFSLTGKMVFSGTSDASIESIDVSSLSEGIYIVEVAKGSEKDIFKLIKE